MTSRAAAQAGSSSDPDGRRPRNRPLRFRDDDSPSPLRPPRSRQRTEADPPPRARPTAARQGKQPAAPRAIRYDERGRPRLKGHTLPVQVIAPAPRLALPASCARRAAPSLLIGAAFGRVDRRAAFGRTTSRTRAPPSPTGTTTPLRL